MRSLFGSLNNRLWLRRSRRDGKPAWNACLCSRTSSIDMDRPIPGLGRTPPDVHGQIVARRTTELLQNAASAHNNYRLGESFLSGGLPGYILMRHQDDMLFYVCFTTMTTMRSPAHLGPQRRPGLGSIFESWGLLALKSTHREERTHRNHTHRSSGQSEFEVHVKGLQC